MQFVDPYCKTKNMLAKNADMDTLKMFFVTVADYHKDRIFYSAVSLGTPLQQQ